MILAPKKAFMKSQKIYLSKKNLKDIKQLPILCEVGWKLLTSDGTLRKTYGLLLPK